MGSILHNPVLVIPTFGTVRVIDSATEGDRIKIAVNFCRICDRSNSIRRTIPAFYNPVKIPILAANSMGVGKLSSAVEV